MTSIKLSLFFFNDTATTEIYTLSLHDALPISPAAAHVEHELGADGGDLRVDVAHADALVEARRERPARHDPDLGVVVDRKSTRLNSSHANISYAVFCLKKITTSHLNVTQSFSA